MTDCIFFPFSHIDSCQKRTIEHFLPGCSYLSMNIEPCAPETSLPGHDTNTLEPVYFSTTEMQKIKQQVLSFQQWAAIHQGHKNSLKVFFDENPWLSDPDNTTGIISQIRKSLPGQGNAPLPVKNSWMESLLILELFRMVDKENQSIHSRLQKAEQKQKALFAQLRGEILEETDQENQIRERCHTQVPLQEPGAWMTEKRVFSWWNAAMHKDLFAGTSPLILVTTSPDVYTFCCQTRQVPTNALDIDPIKVHEDKCSRKEQWQMDFLQCLQDFLSGKDIDRKNLSVSCTRCSDSADTGTGYIRFQILSEKQKLFLAQGNRAGQEKPIGLCLMGLNCMTDKCNKA